MTDTQQLLAEYATNGSEPAFRELVARYINFVYSVALRLVDGDTQLAEDVTQTVFIALARNGRTLSKDVMLGGWLHRHTYHVATKAVRGERRRQSREREAVEMNALQDDSGADWRQVAPILDEAITELGSEDRTAILLRFFEQRDFRTVGEAFGSTEDAARMRVNRALEKLHSLLTHRGVTLSIVALGTVLTAEAVKAAPVGLAAAMSSVALTSAVAGTGTILPLLRAMTMTKLQVGIVAVLTVAGVLALLVIQHQGQVKPRGENQFLRQRRAAVGGNDAAIPPLSADSSTGAVYQSQPAASRPASVSEINQLFELTIARPARSRFIADIELVAPPATEDQIVATLKRENELLKGRDSWMSPDQMSSLITTRSNALVRGMSGRRIQHVTEWYSGHYYRMDQTDEGMLLPDYLQAHSNQYHDTFVNIHDPTFSQYTSFQVNHQLRSAMLTKDPKTYYQAPNDLWRVLGLDQPVAIPLFLALVDIHSMDTNVVHSLGILDADSLLSTLKADSRKVESLHNGTDPNWHLKASDDSLDGILVTRFTLDGKYPEPQRPRPLSSIQAIYWITQMLNRTICLQATLTNLTQGSSFFSKREQIDNNGFPHVWKTSLVKDGVVKERLVVFQEIDPNPTFADEEIFTTSFPTNYNVWDMTSGTAEILQRALPEPLCESPPLTEVNP